MSYLFIMFEVCEVLINMITAATSHPQQGLAALAVGSQSALQAVDIGHTPLGSVASGDESDPAEELRTFRRDQTEPLGWLDSLSLPPAKRPRSVPLTDDIARHIIPIDSLPTINESTPGPRPPQARRHSISSPERLWEINPAPHPSDPYAKRLEIVGDWGPTPWMVPAEPPRLKALPLCPQTPTPISGPSSFLLRPASPMRAPSPSPLQLRPQSPMRAPGPSAGMGEGQDLTRSTNPLPSSMNIIDAGRISDKNRALIDEAFIEIYKIIGALSMSTGFHTTHLLRMFANQQGGIDGRTTNPWNTFQQLYILEDKVELQRIFAAGLKEGD